MRLTKNLKAKIIEKFKSGWSIKTINAWTDVRMERIEQVIMEAMIEADKQAFLMAAQRLVDVKYQPDATTGNTE